MELFWQKSFLIDARQGLKYASDGTQILLKIFWKNCSMKNRSKHSNLTKISPENVLGITSSITKYFNYTAEEKIHYGNVKLLSQDIVSKFRFYD